MLSTKPDDLLAEVQEAVKATRRHIAYQGELTRRYTGKYFNTDRAPSQPVPENLILEFLSFMVPSIMRAPPKCIVKASNPDVTETMPIDPLNPVTMGRQASSIEHGLNMWIEDADVYETLTTLCYDFLQSFAVALVTVDDMPGTRGFELAPRRPLLMRVAQHDFFMDYRAKSGNPLDAQGPRLMGHAWTADLDDLRSDPRYDPEMVERLATDTDLRPWDSNDVSTLTGTSRREASCWDIWVPEVGLTGEPEFNGTIFTLGVAGDRSGVTKQSRFLSEPRPAYCGPWGPYILAGMYIVTNSPFPLSPVVGNAEAMVELIEHITAQTSDARSFKRFVAASTANPADAERARQVNNGEVAMFDDVAQVKTIELGGAPTASYEFVEAATNRFNRSTGMGNSTRGAAQPGVTATADAIAQESTNVRLSGMQSRWRSAAVRIMRSAGWFAHFDDSVMMSVRDQDEMGDYTSGTFVGGLGPGQEHFNFFDYRFSIEANSMEYTGQSLVQAQTRDAMEWLTANAPLMPQIGWLKWRDMARRYFDTLNIGDADQFIDFNMLAQMTQNPALGMAMMPGAGTPAMTPGGLPGAVTLPGAGAGAKFGAPSGAGGLVRARAGELAAANGGGR